LRTVDDGWGLLVTALVAEHTPTTSKKRSAPRPPAGPPSWMLGGTDLDELEPPGEHNAA